MKKLGFVLLIVFIFWPVAVGSLDAFWYAITERNLTTLNWRNGVLVLWTPSWLIMCGICSGLFT